MKRKLNDSGKNAGQIFFSVGSSTTFTHSFFGLSFFVVFLVVFLVVFFCSCIFSFLKDFLDVFFSGFFFRFLTYTYEHFNNRFTVQLMYIIGLLVVLLHVLLSECWF